jgi:hypothetical protein
LLSVRASVGGYIIVALGQEVGGPEPREEHERRLVRVTEQLACVLDQALGELVAEHLADGRVEHIRHPAEEPR